MNYINKKITELIKLPYLFVASNSMKVANDLTQTKLRITTKLITFDIKDLYVNISITHTIYHRGETQFQ